MEFFHQVCLDLPQEPYRLLSIQYLEKVKEEEEEVEEELEDTLKE